MGHGDSTPRSAAEALTGLSLTERGERFTSPPTAGTASPSTGTPGIKLNARANLQRVYVSGFSGTGIEIIADQIAFNTNANNWQIYGGRVDACGGHGLHTDAGDANAGLCLGLSVIGVGGNGFYESSFLGNTYIGCHVEVPKGRAYHADGNGGRNVFVGCYFEGGQPSRIMHPSMFFGGDDTGFADDSTGWIIRTGTDVRPFYVHNPKGSTVETYVGNNDDSNGVLGWRAFDDLYFWMLRWYKAEKVWSTEWANSSAFRASYLTGMDGGVQHPRGAGLQGFPSILLGPANASTKLTTTARLGASGPPFSGTWQPGDIVYNSNPSPGGYIGWVWVAAVGWKGFGLIAP